MHGLGLFSAALGLVEPWEVVDVQFDRERRRLDLRIDFAKGARFPCPECGAAGCAVHDTERLTCWRTPWLVMTASLGVAIGGGERRNELRGDRGLPGCVIAGERRR
jgi:hypothetical protein